MLDLILLIIAAACFAAAAFRLWETRLNLVALGLLAWVVTVIPWER